MVERETMAGDIEVVGGVLQVGVDKVVQYIEY